METWTVGVEGDRAFTMYFLEQYVDTYNLNYFSSGRVQTTLPRLETASLAGSRCLLLEGEPFQSNALGRRQQKSWSDQTVSGRREQSSTVTQLFFCKSVKG